MRAVFLFPALFLLTSYAVGQAAPPAQRLQELGIQLPPMSQSTNNFVKWVRSGNMLYLSGHGSCGEPTAVDRGKLGSDLTTEQGYEAAKRVAICLLASLNDATGGDLGKVKRVVKVLGMVNSAPDYYDQPKVMNGCSDLLVGVFGEKGRHARSAVGMVSLPGNMSVEIEMIVELEE
jgi:enamine deaminase RidA (YjgF/YER057c/UK114 family)